MNSGPWFETRGLAALLITMRRHYFGRLIMKACRLHSATSLSFWL
jgi:hypothetical protein